MKGIDIRRSRLRRVLRVRTPEPPRLPSACYAPHSALYLRPDGGVEACCATGYTLGFVTGPNRQSLQEIWQGAALAQQRAALEAGSYAFGCQECELAEAAGGRHAALAYHFDRFADGSPFEFPQMFDFALSSRCNLQCVMCNGGLSSSIRTKREGLPPLRSAYDDRFFDELDEFLPHVKRMQFKGGEPFLGPENRRIWDRLIELQLRPEMTVTTNGTLFHRNIERYVRELRMDPIISIDAMDAETLESIRVGVVATTLWANVDRYQAITEETGATLTISFCLMAQNWREALPFLQEADRRAINCHIVFVNQPERFDLLRLPHHELEAVHAELAAAPTSFVTYEPGRAWGEVLQRLRSHLEHPVELQVRVGPDTSAADDGQASSDRRSTGRSDPPPPSASMTPTLDEQADERLRSDLAARFGEPLVLEFAHGVVAEAVLPGWAGWLTDVPWQGLPASDIPAAIDRSIGLSEISQLPSSQPGVDELQVSIAAPDRPRQLLVFHFQRSTPGLQRGYVVEAPAP